MPGFEGDALRVVPRVGEQKTEAVRVSFEPAKGRRAGEAFLERRRVRRADIDRPSGVMLAVSGGGIDPQDVVDSLPGADFALDDFGLAIDSAKTAQKQAGGRRQPEISSGDCAVGAALRRDIIGIAG